jgi:hypothetical protein
MRGRALAFVVATLLSTDGLAQVVYQPTATPIVTAEGTPWFLNGEAITWDGGIYAPAGAIRPFDANVMVRSGVFRGIPLYTDSTQQPLSFVLVPLRGGWMQPYERRAFIFPQAGQAAGPPSFGPALVLTAPAIPTAPLPAMVIATDTGAAPEPAGTPAAAVTGVVGTSGRTPASAPRAVTTAVPPTGTNAIWIEFDGRRWYAAEDSIDYVAERLNEIGTYHGWTVYAMKADAQPRTIYIASRPGVLAAYTLTRRTIAR